MDKFGCSIKDLQDAQVPDNVGNVFGRTGNSASRGGDNDNDNDVDIVKDTGTGKRSHVENTGVGKSTSTSVKDIVADTFLNKLKEDRSIKIIITVLILYLLLNSGQVSEMIYNTFPYLMTSSKESNLFGKIIIALIMGISTVISISFYPDP